MLKTIFLEYFKYHFIFLCRKCELDVSNSARVSMRIRGFTSVVNLGKMILGSNLKINSGRRWNLIGGQNYMSFYVGKEGRLLLGDNVGISNSSVVCMDSIEIKNGVLIGGDCKIYDTDFHSLDYEVRVGGNDIAKTKPIVIEENVFIGTGCIVLKGSFIGKNTIVGAGSVVSGHLESNSVYVGNPIRKIR